MFDSRFCPREFTQFPIEFGWQQLRSPILLFLAILIAAVVSLWFITRKWRRNQKWMLPAVATLVFSLIAVGLLSTVVVKGLFLPADPGTSVDAIVILGRGRALRMERARVATQLWQAARAPVIFVSGRGDALPIIELLIDQGVPRNVIDGENCSLTTKENAIFSAAILQQQNVQRILLVTDSPHMWRSLIEFRAYGFTVIPRTSDLSDEWSLPQKAYVALRESVGLPWYLLRQAIAPPSTMMPDAELSVLLQKAQQYGQERLYVD
ncbi:YdcF family protein [Chroococcidiopsis sp. TS-821]|uniref:YdcF family protein n=1 Tax=Chroococcidiopsis sp. TS-821 TaxID=1378066 RepID=UPI00143D73FD|nr:YdcF family protein [Chroococcidiopsis sp. TS-821]